MTGIEFDPNDPAGPNPFQDLEFFSGSPKPNPNNRRRPNEKLPPPPNRSTLTIEAWKRKNIPLRDHLMGGVLCTTSRWFMFGETGVGKTLLAMRLGGAVAAGKNFLNWTGQRKARVMYIDGELPMEDFKDRIEMIAEQYGDDIEFYGYNREDLGDNGLPPLNIPLGQQWIKREIEAIKPDLIIFDSVMCLLIGSMLDEIAWTPPREFVRWLTTQRIAQIWLHHACGFLDLSDKGAVTPSARTTLWKAKRELLAAVTLVEKEGLIWRP